MKKMFLSFVCMNLICSTFLLQAATASTAVQPNKEWTFLTYMAADNSLADFTTIDFQEMMKIGTNNVLNIIVCLFIVDPTKGKIVQWLRVDKGTIEVLGEEQGGDSGSEDYLYAACQWAHTYFPANHFVLNLWDHGSGSVNRMIGSLEHVQSWWQKNGYRSVCYDDTTGNFLTDVKLRNVLSKVKTQLRNGKNIDLVSFDACLMADVEVAYTLQDYVDYMSASQETIPGNGFGYDLLLAKIAQPNVTPVDLALHMVQAYSKEYAGVEDSYTFSSVDLSKTNALVAKLNALANEMITLLKGPSGSKLKKVIKMSADAKVCAHFEEPQYIDLQQFCRNMINNSHFIGLAIDSQTALVQCLNDVIKGVQQAVISEANGPKFGSGIHGLSIFYNVTKVEQAYAELYWSQKTSWVSFLKTLAVTR